jgi:hypothetical protein
LASKGKSKLDWVGMMVDPDHSFFRDYSEKKNGGK